jgi:hypothetical protein
MQWSYSPNIINGGTFLFAYMEYFPNVRCLVKRRISEFGPIDDRKKRLLELTEIVQILPTTSFA